ncbi:hypothetical protein GCM10007116_07680 [Sulfodiicoccus acidiphilus]|uniref:Uncharacterized protein n=1 Tax=Sulfodiicoccus acidiphilus TaxID=1670455 RepID=A0A830H377_9CREN|nr:hypothetical protein GCM10007116_07680 [Sulfodiicoccus acidiphilus]
MLELAVGFHGQVNETHTSADHTPYILGRAKAFTRGKEEVGLDRGGDFSPNTRHIRTRRENPRQ